MSEKTFRFSLEDVLEVRKQATQRAMQSLAQAMHQRQMQEERVRRAEEYLEQLTASGKITGSSGPEHLRRSAAFRQNANRQLTRARQTLQHLKTKEDEARRTLTEARHAEEALLTLRDEEKSAHEQAAKEAEQAFLDEQAVTRHMHDHSLLS